MSVLYRSEVFVVTTHPPLKKREIIGGLFDSLKATCLTMTTPPPFPLPTSQWLPQPCFLVVLGYWLCFVPVVA